MEFTSNYKVSYLEQLVTSYLELLGNQTQKHVLSNRELER